MSSPRTAGVPDHTAVRVALWRALHVELDATPPVFRDEIGLLLAAPEENWRQRPDMHPVGTRGYRAAIVARARFVEDLVQEKLQQGVSQYVVMGAGLDTFAQRNPNRASRMRIFEIDQPETQAWKQQRLKDLGFGASPGLCFVPVDFERGDSWPKNLEAAGFDPQRPATVASTGVAMYLTKEANLATFREIAGLAKGTTLVLSFMLALDLIDSAERTALEVVSERARAAGTPFLSFFRPEEILAMAREAGFSQVEHVSRTDIIERYFSDRSDSLRPASGEEILVATV
jgi:methyltransferase (TIGR00027 family)